MTAATATAPKRKRHTIADFYHERTHFNFIDRSWRWLLVSGTLILISVVAVGVRGLNLGIDFEGGVAVHREPGFGVGERRARTQAGGPRRRQGAHHRNDSARAG